MRVEVGPDLASFRRAARGLLVRGVPPERVLFAEERTEQGSLLATEILPDTAPVPGLAVPPAFLELAERMACHRSPERWGLLYRVLWRLTHGERELLEVESDVDVYRLRSLEKAIRRDSHKMKAFVRFRRVEREGQEHFIAWHRPDHLIVPLVAPFFARRFPSMRWSILTPDASGHWDLERLTFGEGMPRSEAPEGDVLEEATWRSSSRRPGRPSRRSGFGTDQRGPPPGDLLSERPGRRLRSALVLGDVQLGDSALAQVALDGDQQPGARSEVGERDPRLIIVSRIVIAAQDLRGCVVVADFEHRIEVRVNGGESVGPRLGHRPQIGDVP